MPSKVTRREKLTRVLFGVGGAALAILVGVIVNVVSEQVNKALDSPYPATSSAGCVTDSVGYERVDQQFIDVMVSEPDEYCWQRTLDSIEPGDEFRVLMEFRNFTGEQTDDVTLQAWVPEGFELVPGTTEFGNSNYPNGIAASDNVTDPGINLGSYSNGANVWVIFNARMSPTMVRECGLTAWVIGARLTQAPPPEDSWLTAGIISVGRC